MGSTRDRGIRIAIDVSCFAYQSRVHAIRLMPDSEEVHSQTALATQAAARWKMT